MPGVRMENCPTLFWTSALPCQHSGGWHKYLGKEAPWPPWPGQPWNHVQGTVAWTRWGGAENCRPAFPPTLATRGRALLAAQGQMLHNLPWGFWWPLLPLGPLSLTADSGLE